MRDALDEDQILLATLPPSQEQRRLALAIVVVLIAAFLITIPFASTQLPRVDAFIPVLTTAFLINDLVTSALLFSQFSIVPRRALLLLASGYFFSAIMVIPYALTFPGLFAPAGLFDAGLQSSAWLYVIWHLALPLSVILYELLKGANSGTRVSERSVRGEIGLAVAVVIALVCTLTWLATAQHDFLPQLYLDRARLSPLASIVGGLVGLLGVLAFVLLWFRKSSVLDLWLMVTICAWFVEIALQGLLTPDRFSLGFYMIRIYSLVTSSIVLIMLLSEATTLYANLARAIMARRRERDGQNFAMDAMAATIAHEVNQPLGAISLYSQAALRFLAENPPNIDQVRTGLERITRDSVRGSEVIASLRAMFRKAAHKQTLCNMNDLVRNVLRMADIDLRTQRVSALPELAEKLPQVLADRVQLQEVFMNLIMNAIEAVRSGSNRSGYLQIRSGVSEDGRSVLLAVEDSGPGIDKKDMDRIFEPFFTTKSTGTGMGLAICRSIIEAHGGHLWMSAAIPHGSIFHVALPVADTVRGQ
jgi:signal transduction histidine kinase